VGLGVGVGGGSKNCRYLCNLNKIRHAHAMKWRAQRTCLGRLQRAKRFVTPDIAPTNWRYFLPLAVCSLSLRRYGDFCCG